MNIKQQLNCRESLQDYLFRRGFLVSRKSFEMKQFPFYGNWNVKKLSGYYFMTHHLTQLYYVEKKGMTFFLLGHCYNPFTMEWEEVKQLERVAEAFLLGKNEYWDAVNELTGVFVLGYIDKNEISFIADPSGMQSAYYGIVDDNFMITSHPQIIGDLYDLEFDEFVKELIEYKWYTRVTGPYLPADISKYKEVKRIVPNILFSYKEKQVLSKRFYPLNDLKECSQEEYSTVIEDAVKILRNNAELILKKWEKPAISLTGGIDSNTTFAAFNGAYEKIETFSYLSAKKETIDVDAAKVIAEKFNVHHTLYTIPLDPTAIDDYEIKAEIIRHNSGYTTPRRDNEMKKRVFLAENCHIDVEVKSWVSETIRGACFHRYNRRKFPELSPKLLRNLYKIFLTNRCLAKKIDKLYFDFIEKYEYHKIPVQYPPADMQFNEIAWGAWGGTNISEMKCGFDITIPYNNRKFLDLLFRIPLKDRLSDKHHKDMKKSLNKELYDMNIQVANMEETKKRAFFLNTIFTINMHLPF